MAKARPDPFASVSRSEIVTCIAGVWDVIRPIPSDGLHESAALSRENKSPSNAPMAGPRHTARQGKRSHPRLTEDLFFFSALSRVRYLLRPLCTLYMFHSPLLSCEVVRSPSRKMVVRTEALGRVRA